MRHGLQPLEKITGNKSRLLGTLIAVAQYGNKKSRGGRKGGAT
jgi:hypothetical protein